MRSSFSKQNYFSYSLYTHFIPLHFFFFLITRMEISVTSKFYSLFKIEYLQFIRTLNEDNKFYIIC
jgi:hypothetical protein